MRGLGRPHLASACRACERAVLRVAERGGGGQGGGRGGYGLEGGVCDGGRAVGEAAWDPAGGVRGGAPAARLVVTHDIVHGRGGGGGGGEATADLHAFCRGDADQC